MTEKRSSPFTGLDTALLRSTRRKKDDTASASPPGRTLVKATFYLEEAQVLALEQLRLTRRQRGDKVDKSALVREAINGLVAASRRDAP